MTPFALIRIKNENDVGWHLLLRNSRVTPKGRHGVLLALSRLRAYMKNTGQDLTDASLVTTQFIIHGALFSSRNDDRFNSIQKALQTHRHELVSPTINLVLGHSIEVFAERITSDNLRYIYSVVLGAEWAVEIERRDKGSTKVYQGELSDLTETLVEDLQ